MGFSAEALGLQSLAIWPENPIFERQTDKVQVTWSYNLIITKNYQEMDEKDRQR